MAAMRNGTVEKKRKIFLYSSHDINVYAVLAALKVVKPHLPEFTSAVILELLSINEKYYVKVSIIRLRPSWCKNRKDYSLIWN